MKPTITPARSFRILTITVAVTLSIGMLVGAWLYSLKEPDPPDLIVMSDAPYVVNAFCIRTRSALDPQLIVVIWSNGKIYTAEADWPNDLADWKQVAHIQEGAEE